VGIVPKMKLLIAQNLLTVGLPAVTEYEDS
jgi:hypothetical protein